MRMRVTGVLSGLVFAIGTVPTVGTATAAVPTGGRAAAPQTATHRVAGTMEDRARCHIVRGHWRWDRRRGHRVWVPRHRVCP
jgi:hypothetical protein